MPFTDRRPGERIDDHLQHRHSETDDEQAGDDREVGSGGGNQQATQRVQAESPEHRQALPAPFEEEARGYRNYAVRDEEGERQEARKRVIEAVPFDDDRDERPDDVGDEGDQKPDRHDSEHYDAINRAQPIP